MGLGVLGHTGKGRGPAWGAERSGLRAPLPTCFSGWTLKDQHCNKDQSPSPQTANPQKPCALIGALDQTWPGTQRLRVSLPQGSGDKRQEPGWRAGELPARGSARAAGVLMQEGRVRTQAHRETRSRRKLVRRMYARELCSQQLAAQEHSVSVSE